MNESMNQAPKNEKDSLNTQEVKSFVNLRLFAISLMLNYLTPTQQYLIYPYQHWLNVSGALPQSIFLKIKRRENPKHSGS